MAPDGTLQLSMFNAQNIDCGYTLNRLRDVVLMGAHNLCFGAKTRKIGLPL